jgi:SMC interacting uncharacterized protein involved in chromosome segregation
MVKCLSAKNIYIPNTYKEAQAMQELLKTTKADRKDMIRDHQKEIGSHESEIKELKSQADDIKRTSRKLSEENAEKLSRRKIVDKKIGNIKGASNALFLLGAVGIANMWLAIFSDVGVMVLAVLNAIRALNVKNI